MSFLLRRLTERRPDAVRATPSLVTAPDCSTCGATGAAPCLPTCPPAWTEET